MARSNEQTNQKPQLLKSSSFSWDNAFFTSDGVLDADELSSIIEGDSNNLKKHHLQPIPEIDNLEAKLLQKLEASTKKINKIKTQPTTSRSRNNSPLNNTKSPTRIARISTRSKTGKSKSKSDLHSHLSPRASSPLSPISPRSPSSTFSTNQRSSRGTRSSSTNARRKDKPYKSPPFTSHTSSPLGLPNSSSTTSLSSSSTTHKVNQRSISTGRRATTSAYHRSSNRDSSATSSLKTRLTTQAPDRTMKQSQKLYPNCAKERKIQETILKPNNQSSSPSRASRVVTSGKERGSSSASRGVRNIFLVSPEVLDIKGKLNALKMEINMQKKDKCKETKMVPVKISKSESSSSIFKNSSTKMNNQARRS